MHHHHHTEIIGFLGFLLLGLAGSLHCVGMCGPLISLFSSKDKSPVKFGIMYHLSRLLGYATLGLLFGFFGKAIKEVIPAKIFFTLLILGLIYFLFFGESKLNSIVSKITGRFMKPLYKLPANAKRIAIGYFTAFLPCGLLYTAAIASSTAESPLVAAAYMVTFFAGTAPLLIVTQASTNWLTMKLGPKRQVTVYRVLAFVGLGSILAMKMLH